MKSRNKAEKNKFIIKTDEINNKIIKTEGNRKISPNNNHNRAKSNSNSYNNGINTTSPKYRNQNKSKNIYNQKILEIIKYAEDELGSLDSETHIKNAVKILETFQKELIEQLEQDYDENGIKKVLKSNFDKIIRLLIEYFTLYDNKCADCGNNLKKMLKNFMNTYLKGFSDNNIYLEECSSSKSNAKNNISYFDEEKKKEFLNSEEMIVGLINSLSGGIKTCNKNYRATIIDMAKLIEESNNSLVELKNKLDTLSNQLKIKYTPDVQFKKNKNLLVDNILNDVENLYSMNINIIEDVKLLDNNQTSFYEEAKEIFNHLKINHSKKLKDFHRLFESISSINSNINSSEQIIKKRGKSISGNKNDQKDPGYVENNKMNRNNSSKNFNIKKDKNENNKISEDITLNENNTNITIFGLAEQVMEFFNKMKNLQECIVKKISGTNQMKIEFERYKKKLIKLLNNILSNKNNININQNNSRSKLINKTDNDTIIINNKNNINLNNYQTIKALFQNNNKIIKTEQFQIICNTKMKSNEMENKTDEIHIELQTKYNNLLEEINNKSQELNKLQDKINNLILENNELSTKNKKLDSDNKTLLSKMNTLNNSDKKNKNNNFNEFDKVNIDDIISSSNNINNNSINSNQELFKLTDYEVKLKQENKNLKELMNKCVHIIFESIKETSPNMVEDNLINDESEDKIKVNKNNQDENEEEEEFDMEYITEAVKKFQSFNSEIAKNLKKAEEEKIKFEKEAHENLVKAEAYKNALDQAINRINIGEEGDNSENGDKNQNKKQFTFDGDGEISFKDNLGGNINNNISVKNNKDENINKKNNVLNDNNNKNTEENNVNEELNKLIIDSNAEENNQENNKNNEDANKVNKDLLKVQQNLIEKIKLLEEEIEKNKKLINSYFLESGSELYDINEMTVSMTKYNRLLKLLETEQERNKNLEEKYISFINEITEGLSLNNVYKNNNDNKEKSNINNLNNKLNDDNIEFQDHSNKINVNKKINKNRTYGELNVHNDNYLSLLNKDININGDEDEENDDNIKMNKASGGLFKSLQIQELVEENKELKEKENLLSTQLVTIKQELKETRYFLDEMKNKNIELAQEIESQGTLRNQNLIGSLRNGLERLITEMKITNKIKEILIILLRLASYTDEQIEMIFKYKEKKKNIINIFQIE